MPDSGTAAPRPGTGRSAGKFRDPAITVTGEARATVRLRRLRVLWVNTGTVCNLTCTHCYIESSPRNDRLAWFRLSDLRAYLDEIERDGLGTEEIGFTGGEPFMNPDIVAMLEEALGRGYRVLVLTNAMTPMSHHRAELVRLRGRFGGRLSIRVSLDHYTAARHEQERGRRSFGPTLAGLKWLVEAGFAPKVAGRTCWNESEADLRAGFARLFAEEGIPVDCRDSDALVLFPEMDEGADVPEITTRCWGILGVSPDSVMCASGRMVVRRKGAARPSVLACTLVPYDSGFELGNTLAEASGEVALNHPHCARFCVLGGASCSGRS